jgi:hypothetical protein
MFAIAATIVTLLFLGVGVALGYFFGIARTSDGLGAALGTAVAVVWVAAIAMLLAVLGGIALAFETTRPAGKISFMASAAVVVGAISAAIAVPVLGLRQAPPDFAPIYTTTEGSVRITLANEPGFVAGSERVTCSWVIDGGAIDSIGAPDVGTLLGRMLSAQIRPGLEAEGSLIVFGIQADDVNDVGLPIWTGTVPMTSTDGGHAGSLDFADLPIEPQKPGYPPDASWPRTLTGTLTWTCD